MHPLINIFWKKYIELNGSKDILIAYSGGQDSRVLLELCYSAINQLPTTAAQKYNLQAVHINHGLHEESNDWAGYCKHVCENKNIPLHIVAVDIDNSSGDSVEELARIARRREWKKILPVDGSLLLAHHQADQAETLLHRLFRGAGPTGLSAMESSCSFGKGKLLRPLLGIAKEDIEEFALSLDLQYITDSSNSDCKYERNFIRNEILPKLRQRWPKIDNNIERSTILCREQTELLHDNVDKELVSCSGVKPGTLSISKLLDLSLPIFCQVVRRWINKKSFLSPSREQLYRIRDEVMLAVIDGKPRLKIADYEIKRYRDDLYALDVIELNDENYVVEWDVINDLPLPNGKVLSSTYFSKVGMTLPKDINKLMVHVGSNKGKRAKKIFQTFAIPPWERDRYPLIFVKDRLVGIVDLWITPDFLIIKNN